MQSYALKIPLLTVPQSAFGSRVKGALVDERAPAPPPEAVLITPGTPNNTQHVALLLRNTTWTAFLLAWLTGRNLFFKHETGSSTGKPGPAAVWTSVAPDVLWLLLNMVGGQRGFNIQLWLIPLTGIIYLSYCIHSKYNVPPPTYKSRPQV